MGILTLQGWYPVVLVAISCNFFCIGVGSTFGLSAVLLPQIKNETNFIYDDSYDSWVGSSSCLAMAFGCISAGVISDRFGRRFAHLLVALPFIAGWLILGFAKNITMILIGRVITGACTGALRSLGPVYLGEIANPAYRPFLIFSLSLSSTSGIFLGHLFGGYLNWRTACFIMCVPTVLGLCLQAILKESPLWLLYQGEIGKGTEIFTWYRGDSEIAQKELADVLTEQKNRPQSLSFTEGLKTTCSTAFVKPLLTSFLLFTTMQFTGVNSMSFYAQDLLKATFSGNLDPMMLMLVTDATRIFGIFILFFTSKFIPRKKFYVISCSTLVCMLLSLIAYIALEPSGVVWFSIIIILLLVYIGLGSIMISLSWSFVGEIFPSSLRGLGSGIGCSSSFFLLFLVVNVTPIIMVNHGIIAVYSMFAGVTLFAVFFLHFLLPQTDGKTLQEIESGYDDKKINQG
ncbi:facilitated trehalose transporter Tret1-like isoform X2 [Ostrinia nubilalis]|uniref:facilitated trehalose transporter Tret1-like isoform X2 n=1 Tax=Ostrinia furnacalis TaxID=93504 RepID=UPI00103BAC0E|nr:facilitated trehalose transporter Tret1-like isoform X2 [Ostrinia furnacalis]